MNERRRETRFPWRGMIAIVVLGLGGWLFWGRARAPGADEATAAADPASPVSASREVPPAPERPRPVPAEPTAPSPVAEGSAPSGDQERVRFAPNWPAARAAQLEIIRKSGPMARDLADRATRVFTAWTAGLEADAQIETAGECHREGCFVTLTFGSAQRAEAFHEHVLEPADPSADWPGPRQQLEPIPQPGGKMSVTWILLPPS